MGFWDVAKDIAGSVIEEGKKKQKEAKKDIRKKVKRASDSKLKKMYRKADAGKFKRMVKNEMDNRGL